MSLSRRTLLQQASAVAAVGAIGRMPGRWWTTTPADLLADPDEASLRALALVAVEAARAAGASFADARVAGGRSIRIFCEANFRENRGPKMSWPELSMPASYGVRAIVDGAWGFAAGSDMSTDAVRRVAQKAVARARANRPRHRRALELTPVTRGERGTWSTPIKEDPFKIPIGTQADRMFEGILEAGRVKGVDAADINLRWNRSIRVFASSDDSLIVQHTAISETLGGAGLAWTDEHMGANAPAVGLKPGPFGYEAFSGVDIKEEMRRAGEQAVKNSRPMPTTPIDVGRYDIVFNAKMMARLLTGTLVDALNLERAFGYFANSSGTSYLAPPADILGGTKIASPLLTLRGDRTRPQGGATIGWDDEGVRADEFTLVREGVAVDYLTNRQTGAELGDVYRARNEAVRSRGCASGGGGALPSIKLPNLTMEPAKADHSLEDLIAGVKKGFYITDGGIGSDQQVLNTLGYPMGEVRYIQNGKLGGGASGLLYQFITPDFWKRMDGIGGRKTVVDNLAYTGFGSGDPLQLPFATVTTVPARVREINVLTSRRVP